MGRTRAIDRYDGDTSCVNHYDGYDGDTSCGSDDSKEPLLKHVNESTVVKNEPSDSSLGESSSSIKVPLTQRQLASCNTRDLTQLTTSDEGQLDTQDAIQHAPPTTSDERQLNQLNSHDANQHVPPTIHDVGKHAPRIIHDAIPLSCFMSYQQITDASPHASHLSQYLDELRVHATQLHAKDGATAGYTSVDACPIVSYLHENDRLDVSLHERRGQYYPLASTDTYLPITATVN